MTKTERQEIGIQAWKNNKGLGGWEYPTGFGKMYNAIQIIKLMLLKNESTRVIIVVNSDELRNEWRTKIETQIGEQGIVMVETIQYFQIKRLKFFCDLLILDEMSMYFSADRSNIWNGTWIEFKFLLWTDATPDDRQKRDSVFYTKYPCVDRITKKEAVDNKWVTKSQVINFAVELTDEEKEAYEKVENEIDENFGKLSRNFDIVHKCLNGGIVTIEINDGVSTYPQDMELSAYKYCTYVAENNGWHPDYTRYISQGFPSHFDKDSIQFIRDVCSIWTPDKVMGYARKTMTAIRKRLDILYMAKNKIQAILRLLELYPDKQTIIFGQRTEFCTLVTKAINNRFGDIAIEYHSNIQSRALKLDFNGEPTLFGGEEFATYKSGANKGSPKIFGQSTLKKLAVEAIRKNKARVIVTGSAMDRGIDIPRISLGIVTGFTQNSNQDTQRKGRISRLDIENENKEAIFVILFVPKTKEEQFLLKAYGRNDATWITSLEQLNETNMDYDV